MNLPVETLRATSLHRLKRYNINEPNQNPTLPQPPTIFSDFFKKTSFSGAKKIHFPIIPPHKSVIFYRLFSCEPAPIRVILCITTRK